MLGVEKPSENLLLAVDQVPAVPTALEVVGGLFHLLRDLLEVAEQLLLGLILHVHLFQLLLDLALLLGELLPAGLHVRREALSLRLVQELLNLLVELLLLARGILQLLHGLLHRHLPAAPAALLLHLVQEVGQ